MLIGAPFQSLEKVIAIATDYWSMWKARRKKNRLNGSKIAVAKKA